MKYLCYVVAFMVLSILGCVLFLLQKSETTEENPALIVNDRKLSRSDLNQPVAGRMSQEESEGDYLESVITRELLIQEARRQGIGREESFRQAMQSFYEQSLVKVLLNRQYDRFQVTVSEQDLKEYQRWMSSSVTFTLFSYDSMDNVETGKAAVEETRSGRFARFSEFVRQQLFGMQQGEKSKPVLSEGKYLIFQMGMMVPLGEGDVGYQGSLEALKQELNELKKEQLMIGWLHDLREKATIVVMENNRLNR